MKSFRLIAVVLLFSLASGVSFAGIKYVARDGTGDYNCDGVNDNIDIQIALDFVYSSAIYDTVYLKSGIYNISDQIYMKSGTTLTGDSTTVLEVANIQWPTTRRMIINLNDNVTISGFEIDGNNIVYGGNLATIGSVYTDCNNVCIHDMYLHNAPYDPYNSWYRADIISVGDSISIFDNRIDNLRLYGATNTQVYNNIVSGKLHMIHQDNVSIHHNNIRSLLIKGPNGKFELIDGKFEIHNNVIGDINAEGSSQSSNVGLGYIHHNIITTEIVFYSPWEIGFPHNILLENNIIDGGIYVSASELPQNQGYWISGTIRIRNNIIINNDYAIILFMPWGKSGFSLTSEYNCIYTPRGGDCYSSSNNRIAHTGDIYVDPLMDDNYHLKSTGGRWNGSEWIIDDVKSPCIDAGKPGSDYSKEPYPNGGRINIGLYGNTPYASRSWSLDVEEEKPLTFSLAQNSPNPFNPSTTITYSVPEKTPVKLEIFDLSGKKVDTLVNGMKEKGIYTVEWEPENLASGIYLYKIEAGGYTETKKMVFVK